MFEAPVDMLSYISLNPENWQDHSYVALCGVAPQAMLWMLEQHPQVDEISLCLDNDAAGIYAIERFTKKLQEAGYENVSSLLPVYKDWNEQLKKFCLDEPVQESEMVMSY